jgi:hypothetical protein
MKCGQLDCGREQVTVAVEYISAATLDLDCLLELKTCLSLESRVGEKHERRGSSDQDEVAHRDESTQDGHPRIPAHTDDRVGLLASVSLEPMRRQSNSPEPPGEMIERRGHLGRERSGGGRDGNDLDCGQKTQFIGGCGEVGWILERGELQLESGAIGLGSLQIGLGLI